MANKKNNKKANNSNKRKIEEIGVNNDVVEQNKERRGETKSSSIEYEVILATPLYYIINKDGKNVTIKETNSYKKGDMVVLK